MLNTVILAIGFLLVAEGLAYAVFPKGMRYALSVILLLPVDKLRILGLITAVCGAVAVWFAMK